MFDICSVAGSSQAELTGVVGELSVKEQLRLRLKILFRDSPLLTLESWDNLERVDLGESRELVGSGSSEKSAESDDHDVFDWLRFRVGVDMGESYPSTVEGADNVGAEVGVLGAVEGADSLNFEVIEVGIRDSFGSTDVGLKLSSLGPVHLLCFTKMGGVLLPDSVRLGSTHGPVQAFGHVMPRRWLHLAHQQCGVVVCIVVGMTTAGDGIAMVVDGI